MHEQHRQDSRDSFNANRRRKALIISVSDYDKSSSLRPLGFCKNDGEAIYGVLKSQYEIPKKWRLIGRAEGDKIKTAIYDFFRESAKEGDTLFFYFSGHGVHDSFGDTFLASSNISKRFIDKLGYNLKYLEDEAIKKTPATNVIVALDCCFAGAAGLGKEGEDEEAKAIGNMDKVFKEGSGKCILASSLDGQTSYAMQDSTYSLFTYHLLEGLKGAKGKAVDENGYVTPSKLSYYVYDAIPLGKQKPVTRILQSGDIIIAEYPKLKQLSTNDYWLKLLEEGNVKEFNESRKQNAATFPTLRNVKLSKKNLEEANLSGANLETARLEQTNLAGSSLVGARLLSASMSGANLQSAILSDAFLQFAWLANANLRRTLMIKTDLSGANLVFADLSYAILSEVYLSASVLKHSNMTGVIVVAPRKFDGLDCEGADFTNAMIDSSKFVSYLRNTGAKNVPEAEKNKKDLRKKLEGRGVPDIFTYHLVETSDLPE